MCVCVCVCVPAWTKTRLYCWACWKPCTYQGFTRPRVTSFAHAATTTTASTASTRCGVVLAGLAALSQVGHHGSNGHHARLEHILLGMVMHGNGHRTRQQQIKYTRISIVHQAMLASVMSAPSGYTSTRMPAPFMPAPVMSGVKNW